MTGPIRWVPGDNLRGGADGYAGTNAACLFELRAPSFPGGKWTLRSSLPGQVAQVRYGGEADEVKERAEQLLREWVASLGAAFPWLDRFDSAKCGRIYEVAEVVAGALRPAGLGMVDRAGVLVGCGKGGERWSVWVEDALNPHLHFLCHSRYGCALPPCPACGCILPDDPDRNECGCDAGCNDGPHAPGVNALMAVARAGERQRGAAEAAFLAASVAVWREIDRLDALPGGYQGLPPETDLRQAERAAWERYRDLPGGERQ